MRCLSWDSDKEFVELQSSSSLQEAKFTSKSASAVQKKNDAAYATAKLALID